MPPISVVSLAASASAFAFTLGVLSSPGDTEDAANANFGTNAEALIISKAPNTITRKNRWSMIDLTRSSKCNQET
jgi:hypothetical protein